MRRIKYNGYQREEALKIGIYRYEKAREKNRKGVFPNKKFYEWIGALAEVVCRDTYPHLELGGPMATGGDDVSYIEFLYAGYRIETKCSSSTEAREAKFLPFNEKHFHKKKKDFDILYGYIMKTHPENTNTIWELGYIWVDDIDYNKVVWRNVEKKYPAIAIPYKDFKPVKGLKL